MTALPKSALRALEAALRTERPDYAWSVVPVEDDLDAAGDVGATAAPGAGDDDAVNEAA
jgi:hypothetical protein